MQTAIFSRLPIKNIKQKVFNKTTIGGRYFQYGDLNINGKVVKVVETHLDFNQGDTGALNRAEQIHELMDFFATDPYVIICADWNAIVTGYKIITDSGYSIANLEYNTYPAGNNSLWAIDNIICKGFQISYVNIINDSSISDHAAVYADFSIIEDVDRP